MTDVPDADWLRDKGHDVVESRERGPDPGDREVLSWAVTDSRILITIDTDFGPLVFVQNLPHSGLIRLPDVPAQERIALMEQLLEYHEQALTSGAIVTVRGGRVRISRHPR